MNFGKVGGNLKQKFETKPVETLQELELVMPYIRKKAGKIIDVYWEYGLTNGLGRDDLKSVTIGEHYPGYANGQPGYVVVEAECYPDTSCSCCGAGMPCYCDYDESESADDEFKHISLYVPFSFFSMSEQQIDVEVKKIAEQKKTEEMEKQFHDVEEDFFL
jgi:hypothetical protein